MARRGKNGEKSGRFKTETLKFLLQGEANTQEVYHHLSDKYRYAPSMPQVGNILSKWKLLSKTERRDRVGRPGPSYHHDDGAWWTVAVWEINDREEALEYIRRYEERAYHHRKATIPN